MTETNIATLRSHEWRRVGSVGRLFANVWVFLVVLRRMFTNFINREARLVDDDMNDVEEGKDGEMLVRGPTVFKFVLNQFLTPYFKKLI